MTIFQNLMNLLVGREMKWPASLIVVRHDVSSYNRTKIERQKDELYKEFQTAFDADYTSAEARRLALLVNEKFALNVSDQATPVAEYLAERAVNTGRNLRLTEQLPDVIFVSPYLRTKQTLEALMVGWPELRNVRVYEEERIREQSHGFAGLYNDWQVFNVLHPDQKKLYDQDGAYWYQWPQGENVPQVRDRVRSWMNTLTRDFAGKRVLAVSHHLAKLALRANLERWDAEEFHRVDVEEKPINCGVTKYVGQPHLGKAGRFALDYYNADLSGPVG